MTQLLKILWIEMILTENQKRNYLDYLGIRIEQLGEWEIARAKAENFIETRIKEACEQGTHRDIKIGFFLDRNVPLQWQCLWCERIFPKIILFRWIKLLYFYCRNKINYAFCKLS